MEVQTKNVLMDALSCAGEPDLATVNELLKGIQRDGHAAPRCPPCAFAQYTYVGADEISGINRCYFWKINDSAEREPVLYWQCLEDLRPLARELLWLLVSPQVQSDDLRLFSKMVRALPSCRSNDGAKIDRQMGFLLIDVVIRDFIGIEDWVCKALELFLEQCSSADRQIYLLTMLDTLICCAEGVLDGCPEERESRREYKRKLNSINSYLENRFGEMITKLEESFFKEYFGIEDMSESFHSMVSVGKLPEGVRYYARALILRDSCGMKISEELSRTLVIGAIAFDDMAHFWKDRDYRVVSLVSAKCLCGMKNFALRWNEYAENLAQMLYVGLHDDGAIDRHSYDERVGMYLETAVAMVDNLCLRRQFEVALLVWQDAWNVCVTALYGCILSDTPLNMVQCLYTYRMKYMPGSSPDEVSATLLDQVPTLVMRNGGMINVQEACRQTLQRNQQ